LRKSLRPLRLLFLDSTPSAPRICRASKR
jgi:hypothetical protein